MFWGTCFFPKVWCMSFQRQLKVHKRKEHTEARHARHAGHSVVIPQKCACRESMAVILKMKVLQLAFRTPATYGPWDDVSLVATRQNSIGAHAFRKKRNLLAFSVWCCRSSNESMKQSGPCMSSKPSHPQRSAHVITIEPRSAWRPPCVSKQQSVPNPINLQDGPSFYSWTWLLFVFFVGQLAYVGLLTPGFRWRVGGRRRRRPPLFQTWFCVFHLFVSESVFLFFLIFFWNTIFSCRFLLLTRWLLCPKKWLHCFTSFTVSPGSWAGKENEDREAKKDEAAELDLRTQHVW